MRFINIICMLVLFQFCSHSDTPTEHYVDKNAKGRNNGTSWSNAWKSFSDIDWNQIQPGDVLYISGGADSTVYYEQLHIGDVQGTADNHITIRNSWESGHNGRVIIDGSNETRDNSVLIGGGYGYTTSYITVRGIECRRATRGIYVHVYASDITIDSCYLYDFYDQAGVKTEGAGTYGITNVTIRNCKVSTFVDIDGQTDGLYLQRTDGIVINNNYVNIRNYSPINNHSDGIQTHLVKDMRIYNNVVICDSGAQGMPMILRAESDGPIADSVIIYNNYMYLGGLWFDGAPWLNVMDQQAETGAYEPPTIIIHNTMVSHGPYVMGVWLERNGEQKTRMYNNIIAQYGDGVGYSGYWHNTLRGNALKVDSITSGLYYSAWDDFDVTGSVTGNWNSGGCSSWSSWTNTYGGTGVYGDPLFVDNIGNVSDQSTLDGELQVGSPAINAGENVQAIVEGMGLPWTDINGVARDNTPDIGAYEYVP